VGPPIVDLSREGVDVDRASVTIALNFQSHPSTRLVVRAALHCRWSALTFVSSGPHFFFPRNETFSRADVSERQLVMFKRVARSRANVQSSGAEGHRFRIELAIGELNRRFEGQNVRDSNNRTVGAALLGAGAIVPALLFAVHSNGWGLIASLYIVAGAGFGGFAIRPRIISEISTIVVRQEVLGARTDDDAGLWLFDNMKALIADREIMLADRHRLVRAGLQLMVAGIVAILLAGSPWSLDSILRDIAVAVQLH
jgi:hypothetical protein